MKLITALKSEMLKTKRTASFYFTLIGAAPVPAIFMLNIFSGGSDLTSIKSDPINIIYELGIERNGFVFYPLFVILVCTLLPQIEYRNNTWKQVLASPQTKGNVFMAKFLNINLLILLFLFVNLFYITLTIVITNFVQPSLNIFHHHFDFKLLMIRTGNSYMSMLAVCAFQFWLGLRFRNFIIPTAVGLVLWVAGMMMNFELHSSIVEYFPYSFQMFPFIESVQSKMTTIVLTSAGFATAFLLLGFLDFRRRRLAS